MPEAFAAAVDPSLSPEELRRYARHAILPEVGLGGQRKIKAARVLCVGAGGLGSPLALYLAAAGVGTLGVVDFDVVDESNLQRQVIHGTSDVGRPKLASAAARIADINPHVELVPFEARLSAENAMEIVRDFDVVADGTDNFPTRYLVNDACVFAGKPNVYASIYRFEGQASVFRPGHGPCYRCLYPEPPPPGAVPSCAEGGVLGVLPGLLGTIQATETLKLVLGIGSPLVGRLLLVDALAMRFREVKIARNPECPVCGKNPTITTPEETAASCAIGEPPALPAIDVEELKRKMDAREDFVLLDVREPREIAIAELPGSVKIPLGNLPIEMGRLPKDSEIVVHCKSGARSAQAVEILRAAGFANVKNLDGGIDRWSRAIDPSVPRY